jgi:hypothetical protein
LQAVQPKVCILDATKPDRTRTLQLLVERHTANGLLLRSDLYQQPAGD